MPEDLDAFKQKLEDHKESRKPKPQSNEKAGVQAGIELAGSIFIPTFIGYWIDDYLGTLPAFMITLFFLGTGAGFYSIYKITQNLGSGVGTSQLHTEEKHAKTSSTLEKDTLDTEDERG